MSSKPTGSSHSPAVPGGVRAAGPGDLEQLTALWMLLAHHHEPLDPSFALRPGAEHEVRALLSAQLGDRDAACFVWDEAASKEFPNSGGLAGLCMVRIDRAPPIHLEVERAEVTDLVVRSDRRRAGLGSTLLAAARGWVEARGISRIEVRVSARNSEGQAFWRRHGFGDWMQVLHRSA
ncbi:GNAT family N-acetyltransferase [Myxococcota bacterium]|nr:GNAT family N-acetyltransferase [Myxococcota bacterium]